MEDRDDGMPTGASEPGSDVSGAQVPPAPPAPPTAPPAPPAAPAAPSGAAPQASPFAGEKNKLVAGILGILLGAFGVHKFYLGYTKEGIIMIAVTFVSFGMLAWVTSIVGLVEGILYLIKTDEDFHATYVAGQKGWF
jgi:TM2 domain-containing membrane protein YozV